MSCQVACQGEGEGDRDRSNQTNQIAPLEARVELLANLPILHVAPIVEEERDIGPTLWYLVAPVLELVHPAVLHDVDRVLLRRGKEDRIDPTDIVFEKGPLVVDEHDAALRGAVGYQSKGE